MAEVISFRDQFDTADRADITGYAGWVARTTETMQVFAAQAIALAGADPTYARQEGSWLVADEIEGDMRFISTGLAGTKSATLSIGSGGASNGAATIGFAIRIVETAGVWTIARAVNPAALLAAATWQTVATLFPAQVNGSHVGVVQSIRVQWKVTLAGVRVLAWWNGSANAEPALDHVYSANWPEGLTAPRGYLLLGIDDSAAADEIRVLGLEVTATTPDGDTPARSADYASVTEVIARTLDRFQGNRQVASFTNERLLALLQEAQDDILTRIENVAWFRRRIEDITLAADSDNVVTMPLQVADVIDIETRYGERVEWRALGHNTDGQLVIRIVRGCDAKVTYIAKREQLVMNGSVGIHRNIDGALVAKLAALMAQSHASAEDMQLRNSQAEAAIATAVTYCQQRKQSTKTVLTPIGIRRRGRFQENRGGW